MVENGLLPASIPIDLPLRESLRIARRGGSKLQRRPNARGPAGPHRLERTAEGGKIDGFLAARLFFGQDRPGRFQKIRSLTSLNGFSHQKLSGKKFCSITRKKFLTLLKLR